MKRRPDECDSRSDDVSLFAFQWMVGAPVVQGNEFEERARLVLRSFSLFVCASVYWDGNQTFTGALTNKEIR